MTTGGGVLFVSVGPQRPKSGDDRGQPQASERLGLGLGAAGVPGDSSRAQGPDGQRGVPSAVGRGPSQGPGARLLGGHPRPPAPGGIQIRVDKQ